ncbi:PRC-barrel domain-containing protein [Hoeflea sp. YIM 152468]|uniref:PRC-barrel domain-containing protein n=1 Tax=Hoeflea sp. YIM 152468 TaxID=3031759 RepID=UPI0023DBB4C0|nr:PRC-barrel domain-containing protein [Hoeflea sp. YIM 152468]MDF1609404.1 PRC-barrel domain-containing protein [Hoeflea sp. YIM 152468]
MSRFLASSALALVFGLVSGTVATAQQSFSDLDTNRDQQVDRTEFQQVSNATFTDWDSDANQRISNDELHGGVFANWDRDSNGALSPNEYRTGSQAWLGTSAHPGFSAIDADGNGSLNRQEFETAARDSTAFADWNTEGEGVDMAGFHNALFKVYDKDRSDQVSRSDYDAVVILSATEIAPVSDSASTLQTGDTQAAASESSGAAIPAEKVIALSDWQMDEVYTDGISVDRVLDDAEVHGAGGDEIGSIENVVFSRDGKVVSVIAEVGGFWDMFDTHVSVPWDQLSWNGMERINIPVTEDNVEDYSVFKSDYLTSAAAQEGVEVVDDDLRTGQNAFRASDLIGDYSRVRQDGRLVTYGYVNDLIIKDGRLQTVVVTTDSGYGVSGPRGYPFYRQGWNPRAPYYDMPYDTAEAIEAEQVEYDRFETN